jgi:hypothetical protein
MLTSICLPGTDDSYHIVPFCERYDQQAASIRMADDDLPIFVLGVAFIAYCATIQAVVKMSK